MNKRTLLPFLIALTPLAGAAFGQNVSRSFNPTSYTPGQPVTVTLTVQQGVLGAEDEAPSGWTVSNLSAGLVQDGTRKVKYFDLGAAAKTLTYQATPPAGSSGSQQFNGTYSTGGSEIPIQGSSTISSGGGGGGGSAKVTRSFSPGSYTPSQPVAVSLMVQAGVLGLEDKAPSGWAVANLSAGLVQDGTNGVKYFDLGAAAKTLTYQATPPAGTSGTQQFVGVYSEGGPEIPIGGSTSIGSAPVSTCTTQNKLCLNSDRFEVTMTWLTNQGTSGLGSVARERDGVLPAGTEDSGALWFFSANNWEVLVKVLNACSINSQYWVFAAATTNVGYTLRVTDTGTSPPTVKEYTNPVGTASPAITDTQAFATCP